MSGDNKPKEAKRVSALLVVAVLVFLAMLLAPDEFDATVKLFSDWTATLNILSPQAEANPEINVVVEAPDMKPVADAIIRAGEQNGQVLQQQLGLQQYQIACEQRKAEIPVIGRGILSFFGIDPCRNVPRP